ncbi:hypothetical protein [Candidatus Albibeggiatoa sp. nov. NOAA]|uniref:cysteine hydrolase family protein n=1 Tax=Candidatus Albibeggiatoa sp. nov. NOAA TaxID=3162724 RepID=UPI0032FB472A|nr:hypothetical protein [Thiotrichaceae bacterium]
MNLQFLIIDPQYDFADPNGHLFVPNADQDALRLAAMLERHMQQIQSIHVTLDSHHWFDIAHPAFWVNTQGQHPEPFTLITEQDIELGQWRTAKAACQNRAREYVKSLKRNARYDLVVWPPHCLIGQKGHSIVEPIAQQLNAWESQQFTVDYIIKGTNIWTEHYSAVQADVPDPEDSGTHLNTALITELKHADIIAISGQALSHCVANTIYDIAEFFEPQEMQKLVLIEDTTSSVSGFEHLGETFMQTMQQRGMRVAKSTDMLV